MAIKLTHRFLFDVFLCIFCQKNVLHGRVPEALPSTMSVYFCQKAKKKRQVDMHPKVYGLKQYKNRQELESVAAVDMNWATVYTNASNHQF